MKHNDPTFEFEQIMADAPAFLPMKYCPDPDNCNYADCPTAFCDKNMTESHPRWPEAPQICTHANLPSFSRKEQLLQFIEINSPRCHVTKLWWCAACSGFHCLTSAPSPSGDSSGTGRHSK